jgi:hypothetical protein
LNALRTTALSALMRVEARISQITQRPIQRFNPSIARDSFSNADKAPPRIGVLWRGEAFARAVVGVAGSGRCGVGVCLAASRHALYWQRTARKPRRAQF